MVVYLKCIWFKTKIIVLSFLKHKYIGDIQYNDKAALFPEQKVQIKQNNNKCGVYNLCVVFLVLLSRDAQYIIYHNDYLPKIEILFKECIGQFGYLAIPLLLFSYCYNVMKLLNALYCINFAVFLSTFDLFQCSAVVEVWMLCIGPHFHSIKNTPCQNLKSVLFISKKEMVAKREEVVERGWSQKCHAGRDL